MSSSLEKTGQEVSRRAFVQRMGACVCMASVAPGLACSSVPTLVADVVNDAEGKRASVSLSVFEARAHEGRYLKVDVGRRMAPLVLIAVAGQPGVFRALSSTCTHLGCQVRPRGQRLHCPCHGSIFDLKGQVVRGPATRALQRFEVRAEPEHDVIWIDLSSGV